MDLQEAQVLARSEWTLPCGHSSKDSESDYYNQYCGKCGRDIKGVNPPDDVLKARHIVNEEL